MKLRFAIVAVLLLALGDGFIWVQAASAAEPPHLTVSFLDIGQGDSIFIESPTGVQVLIDGGRDGRVLREIARQMHWRDRTIDMVLATHPDADHIGGLSDVLMRYDVASVVYSSVTGDTTDNNAFLAAVANEVRTQSATELVAQRGQIFDLGGGVQLQILFPDRYVEGLETNTGSVVVRLVYGDTSFMLTGDSPQAIEEYLVTLDGAALQSTVLKAGHHGSKTSSSPLFVGYVNPEYVVFSRGCDNRYGHPHQEVVDLFARFEVTAQDTCTDGTITFISDGVQVTLEK